MESLVWSFTSINSFKMDIAWLLDSCICFEFLCNASATEFVSSIILPIVMTFSVALCVSSAWFVAPLAISPTALSTCSIARAVWVASLSKLSDALNRLLLCAWMSCIIRTISLRSDATERLIMPVSSFRFSKRSAALFSVKSILDIFSTIFEITISGLVILPVINAAKNANITTTIANATTPVFIILLIGAKMSSLSAVMTRIVGSFLVT